MSPQQEATASSFVWLILGLKEFTKVVESLTRHEAVLAASKPLASIKVSKYSDYMQ